MKLGILAKRAGKLANDNSPAILTAIGLTGTVMTAYLTGKASFKAAEIISEAEGHSSLPHPETNEEIPVKFDELEFKEKFELTWKLFVPAVGTGILTLACIIAANHIGTRRAAALASAYTISEKAFAEYKDKVIEKVGEKKEQGVREELAQDRVNQSPPSREVILASGDVLCCDLYTMRYFKSDMESLRRSVNDLNRQLLHDGYASLTDFYDKIGLPKTTESDEVGWTSDTEMDVEYSTTLTDTNLPCITFEFRVLPVRRFYKSYL